MDNRTSITLLELNERVKNHLDNVFLKSPIWVVAEIAQIRQSGLHYYLELVENIGGKMEAKTSAVIWGRGWDAIHLKLKTGAVRQVLKQGSKVLLQVEVSFHVVYGLKLVIKDLDLSYTLGELEAKRRATIEQLNKEGKIGLNAQLDFSLVVSKIALVASPNTSGYKDFVEHLTQNPYGYKFEVVNFVASVQGAAAEKRLIQQIKKAQKYPFDIVVLIRGGGSKLDLEVFNAYDLSSTIAECKIPVITGIGHETDTSVADMVAAIPLKTPTAAAAFIIEKNMNFEAEILETARNIGQMGEGVVEFENYDIEQKKSLLKSQTQHLLRLEQNQLNTKEKQLGIFSKNSILLQKHLLNTQERTLELLDITNTLKRGYTITQKDNTAIKSGKKLKKGDEITTIFNDEKVKSVVV